MTPLRRYHEASHLLVAERLGDGDLLLDAASGPIAQPEYLSYQKGFARRVCVDFSMTALTEAKAKLGDSADYVQADITALPFPDGLFDGVVSGYTIQHIDRDLQTEALGELYRVLAAGGRLEVINNGKPGPLSGFARRLALAPWKLLAKLRTAPKAQESPAPGDALYGYNQTPDWWRAQAARLGADGGPRCLRLLYDWEAQALPAGLLGLVIAVERRFARYLTGAAAYLLIDLSKPI